MLTSVKVTAEERIWDDAERPGWYQRAVIVPRQWTLLTGIYGYPVNVCELRLKQALERPLVPSPIPDGPTLPSLTVMHKYFNSNALHLEIKGLIQML